MSAHLIHTKHQDGAAMALRTALKQALKALALPEGCKCKARTGARRRREGAKIPTQTQTRARQR
eukprot:scaffold41415_cov264-Isochrysis_galbana.AAC.7